MRSPYAGRAAVLLLLALVMTGCGSGSSSTSATGGGTAPTAADLDNHDYVSSSVEGHDVVPGTTIAIGFHDSSMLVNAGCNSMFGAYGVTGGVLKWTSPAASTQIACPDAQMKQDQWISGLLTDGMDATLDGDALTLTSGDVVIHLGPKPTADASAVFGHTWTVTDLTTPHSASAIPDGVRTPTLAFAGDGSVQVDTGCNTGHSHATATADTLHFTPVATTRMACDDASMQVETAVLKALEGTVTVTLDGDIATFDNGTHGLGLTLSHHS